MSSGRQVDWLAIPARYRRWQAQPTWRKLVWLVTRSVSMVVLYVVFAVGILWYNAPTVMEGIGAGRTSVWALVGLLGTQPELVGILVILVPAVIGGVLLPHKPSWQT